MTSCILIQLYWVPPCFRVAFGSQSKGSNLGKSHFTYRSCCSDFNDSSFQGRPQGLSSAEKTHARTAHHLASQCSQPLCQLQCLLPARVRVRPPFWSCRVQGRLMEAVEAYERALMAAPNFEIVRNNLAIALTELGTRTKTKGEPHAELQQLLARQWLTADICPHADPSPCKIR